MSPDVVSLEELALRAWRERRPADIDRLVRLMRGLIGREASKAARRFGLEQEDLAQQGAIGILLALEKFDPARGGFRAIATIWVRDAILRYAENNADPVSRHRSKAEGWVQRHAGRLYHGHTERDPSLMPREICELIAEEATAATGRRVDADRVEASLALSLGRGELAEAECVAAPSVEVSDAPAVIARLLDQLPPRTRAVIRARFFG
ncbi:MAG: sigma-70 family RNA polymerase sigma factor [Amaricoccus sp.]